MAQENVEIVRRSLEAFNHSGIEAALAFDDPDIEWITTGTYAEANTYRGHAGVAITSAPMRPSSRTCA